MTDWINTQRQHVEQQLAERLPADDSKLHQAMRYTCLQGGKRLRPLLVYAAGLSFGAEQQPLDTIAVAIELIHCYSLVHDDLPAMDDDDLRRGQPSCHKAFDEATAILVGDALQSLAFEQLSQPDAIPNQLTIINILAKASGSHGMAGGQSLDMLSNDSDTSIATLETIHQLKTGALFSAAMQMGALAATQCTPTQLDAINDASNHLGLAFQIRDDILDIESNEHTLGKSIGKDQAQHKATYPALLGLEESRNLLKTHLESAHSIIKTCTDKPFFDSVIHLLV
ncbi:MAG: geranyl transferase [Coxiella sp. (in: Bacteria)]|nr:MAG: geranyl transferase [Coxiella sp. (in: g-proteobacteria)]